MNSLGFVNLLRMFGGGLVRIYSHPKHSIHVLAPSWSANSYIRVGVIQAVGVSKDVLKLERVSYDGLTDIRGSAI